MLTQKDLYDYINKHGVDAYDQMAKELADNINSAKDKYLAQKKTEDEKKALVDARVNTLSDLFTDWFEPDFFKTMSADQIAKSVYSAVEDFGKANDEILKHAKNVKTETKKIPGGTETITKAELSKEDFDKAMHDLLDAFKYAFNW